MFTNILLFLSLYGYVYHSHLMIYRREINHSNTMLALLSLITFCKLWLLTPV